MSTPVEQVRSTGRIYLGTITLVQWEDGRLTVEHPRGSTEVSPAQLERWGLTKLREQFTRLVNKVA